MPATHTPSASDMLEKIEALMWGTVVDDAAQLPDVLGTAATDWVTYLPFPDRAIMATAWQHHDNMQSAWSRAAQSHGPTSAQARQAQVSATKASSAKDAAIVAAMQTARNLILATVIDYDSRE